MMSIFVLKKSHFSGLLALLITGCSIPVSTDRLQLGNGQGARFDIQGKSYEQIWRAATIAMSQDMNIVENHKPSGVIKSRVTTGTRGKVVGFFITPTDPNATRYSVVIVSRKPNQTDFVDRDWEPSVWEDFNNALVGR
jgi:hypothetical protein